MKIPPKNTSEQRSEILLTGPRVHKTSHHFAAMSTLAILAAIVGVTPTPECYKNFGSSNSILCWALAAFKVDAK
jgi:hypothetical protein